MIVTNFPRTVGSSSTRWSRWRTARRWRPAWF